ncbi:ATP-dependent DNA helicase DDX11, partial [Drosophila navojoa]
MYSPRKSLSTPAAHEFGFPYTPYEIQEQLMQQLFQVLEHKQIGIFESPTGTGKSLTLTCGALTWLRQHEQLVRTELLQRIDEVQTQLKQLQMESAQAEDWITAQSNTRTQRLELEQLHRLRELLQQKEQELEQIKHRKKQQKEQHRPARRASDLKETPVEEQEELNSDEELDNVESVSDEQPAELQSERFRDVQIFFCSRTHSQLSQIVAELRKTPHGQSVRCIALGSRQQLCINAQVRKLSNIGLINERCLDMAQSKISANAVSKSRQTLSRCAYKSSAQLQRLSDAALCEPLDIEELVAEGSTHGGCPYYATRAAQSQAQLLLLPYPMLLQRSARQQLGLDLRGAIIIVDEAHNLLDTIAQLHSSELSLAQLQLAKQQLSGYKQRYARRLSSANLLRINQLLYVVRRLLQLLEAGGEPRMLRTYELSAEGDFFNIDLHELLEFCARTRLAQKMQSFGRQQQREPQPSENRPPPTQQLLQRLAAQHEQHCQTLGKGKRKAADEKADDKAKQPPQSQPAAQTPAMPSPFRPLLAFLETLTSNAADGRVLLNPETATLKYLLLNPAEHFADIVKEARALIIAGGTMRPTQELTEQLFAHCPERVVERFYDHVVPADAVLPFILPTGPTGARLCFSYAERSSPAMVWIGHGN